MFSRNSVKNSDLFKWTDHDGDAILFVGSRLMMRIERKLFRARKRYWAVILIQVLVLVIEHIG
jgi:hypothetical protein